MCSITLWTSLKGDFCIHTSSVHNIASLEQFLIKTAPLLPPKRDRTFFCPFTFVQENNNSLSSLLFSYGFTQIYSYPMQQRIETPEQWKNIVSATCLQEALLRQNSHVPKVLYFAADARSSYSTICTFLEGSPPPNHLTIDLELISHNIEIVRSQISNTTRLLAMVKAHGYGTEEALLCRFLRNKDVDIVGVAHVEEALQLRYEGIEQSIFIINVSELEMEKALLADAEIGLYTSEQINAASNAALQAGKTIFVHLHVDTGMKRFGAPLEKALELALLIKEQPNLRFRGLFSHFPASDNPHDDTFTKKQINDFQKLLVTLQKHNITPKDVHMANSAAIFRFPHAEGTMVRLGIALYGYSPSTAISFPSLSPALTLETTIAGIIEGKKGETVSYGRHYTIPHIEAKLAILPLGYYDGLHRQHSNKQTVLIDNKHAPIVGNICMDYMMIDVTDIPNVKVGDKAILFGTTAHNKHICPLHFAEKGGTIVHELLTCLGPRIRRLFTLK